MAGREAKRQFPPDLDAALTARDFVIATLTAWGCQTDEAVMVMSSELIVNAVKHAKSDYEVRVFEHDGRVRVEVRDWSTDRPVMGDPAIDDTHGRGLRIVSDLAPDWGVEPAIEGKTVWFEIDRPCQP
jgi:anti-sigma regulatory factor (Ser/Thr protein kinase)